MFHVKRSGKKEAVHRNSDVTTKMFHVKQKKKQV